MTTEGEGATGGAGEKLYAGKFKTVEALEEGYKSSAVVFDENTNLKQKVDELSKVPDSYVTPPDVSLDAGRVTDIQARAKEAGMTQAQYEKFLRGDKSRVDAHNAAFDQAKKEMSEADLNLLNDYVDKNYPQSVAEQMKRKFIADKKARAEAMADRETKLKSVVPGVGKTVPGGDSGEVTDEDVRKAYDAKEKNRNDPKLQQAYLNLVARKAEQKKAS